MTQPQALEKRSYLVGGTEIAARPLAPALYLVATPIGNLGDITLRALETLAAADVLACEDTRVTRVLLDRYGIRQRPFAYHEHNADEAGPQPDRRAGSRQERGAGLRRRHAPGLRSGLSPGRSGAGARHEVVPIPGASAVLAALTASGLPSDAFLFAGFLPVKDGQRRARLDALKAVPATLIFFESPRRLADTLAEMRIVLGGARQAAIGRELTKTFEEMRTRRAGRACRALCRKRRYAAR